MRARSIPSSNRTVGRSLRWLRRSNERMQAEHEAALYLGCAWLVVALAVLL